MALGLLCLGLTLLGALKTYASDISSNLLPTSSLNEVPLQPDFQETLFQGKWYGIGVAENTNKKGKQRKINMFSTIYELKDDHTYKVTSTLLRGQVCDHWTRTFVPSVYSGQFTLGNMPSFFQLRSYTIKVVATNYHEFAIVYIEKDFTSSVLSSATLYGRTKKLGPSLKKDFVNFATFLGFNENTVFTEPTEQCIDD